MKRSIVCFFLLAFVLQSCQFFQPKKKKDAVARVGDKFLYHTDISNLGVNGEEPEDSAQIVDAYIDSWIRRQIFLNNAKKNLDLVQQNEVREKVDDYQESLLMHLYESKMVKNKVDTLITDDEIEQYYDDHLTDFAISDPIIKYIWIKQDRSNTNSFEINSVLKNIDGTNDFALKEYCTFNAVDCKIDPDHWEKVSTFYTNFPDVEDPSSIKTNEGSVYREQGANYHYIYKILEKKTFGVYPLEFVTENIKKIILRNREIDYIENLRLDIYNQAINKNEVQVY